MLFVDFVVWWYGRGWAMRFKSIGLQLAHWAQYFSLGTLLKTLFAPWHQNVVPQPPDQSLDAVFRRMVDNAISRFVGFWVRLIVFFSGIVLMLLVVVVNFLFGLIWPFIPLLPLAIIILGVT